MTKATKIQMEWIELGFEPLSWDEGGWIDFEDLPENFDIGNLDAKHYQEADVDFRTTLVRPKALRGIDDNNSWIKIENEDTIPDQGTIVIGYSKEWIDEDFNPSGQRQCHYCGIYPNLEWISAKWLDYQDTWLNDEETKPTHWHRLEELLSPIY
jgi:hypothetical protein